MMARAGVVCRRAVNVGVDPLIVVYSWLGGKGVMASMDGDSVDEDEFGAFGCGP